jgi:hypothetical protein
MYTRQSSPQQWQHLRMTCQDEFSLFTQPPPEPLSLPEEAGKTIANFLRLHSVQPHTAMPSRLSYQTPQFLRQLFGSTLVQPLLRPASRHFPYLVLTPLCWGHAVSFDRPRLTFFVFIRLHACGLDRLRDALVATCLYREAKCICNCGEWCQMNTIWIDHCPPALAPRCAADWGVCIPFAKTW